MNESRRKRREWRIFLWVSLTSAAISAYFGYAVAPADQPPAMGIMQGVLTSLLITTPIVFFELPRTRLGPLRWLQRLPLAGYFVIKVLFYATVIVGGLVLSRFLIRPISLQPIAFDEVFRNSLFFAVGMSLFGNFVVEMGRLLGFGTLKNLMIGRYTRPVREQRAFLLIDMRDSTGLAERLGSVRFHELLNAFFRDIADAALASDAEIYKYLGDEAILTWTKDQLLPESDCLSCPFVARDLIARNAERYRSRFGVVPEFRAALHYGEIVTGEIGDIKREIAYVGDTLNVAARLLEAAKLLGRDVLASSDVLDLSALPADIRSESLPMLTVRGRAAPLAISALSRVGNY